MAAWPWAQRTADAIETLLTSRYIHLYCELLDQVGDKVGGRWLVVQIKKRRFEPFQGRRSSPLLESARSCAQAASVSDRPCVAPCAGLGGGSPRSRAFPRCLGGQI